MSQVLAKRSWFYLQPPAAFDLPPCDCGNDQTQWSEYEHHLWCDKCQKDFEPVHNGVFGGPVPVGICSALGISFDRFNIQKNRVERFDPDTGVYQP